MASGPSVTAEDVALLRGRCKVAVVNTSHELAPWADLLYAADGKWWHLYPAARTFAGLKATPDDRAAKDFRLHRVTLLGEVDTDDDRFSLDLHGSIARGGNSAFQTVNLVTQFGCRRQIWLGFDFQGEHWHGKHPDTLKNPRPHTLQKWARRLDANAATLARMGVEVINASPASALKNYRKMLLRDALDAWCR